MTRPRRGAAGAPPTRTAPRTTPAREQATELAPGARTTDRGRAADGLPAPAPRPAPGSEPDAVPVGTWTPPLIGGDVPSDETALATRYPHLRSSALEVVEATRDERVRFIRTDRWIGYPTAKRALDRMEDLLVWPRAIRMPNLLLIGDTNNGKTAILRRFQQLHPADDAPGMDGVVVPVVAILAPPRPDEHRLWVNFLRALNAPFRESERTGKLRAQAVDLLRHVDTRALVVDEVHNLMRGTVDKQRHIMAVVRDFVNELQIPIIAAGIEDARNVFTSDPQLANRFRECVLPRWDVTSDFLTFLARLERMLPLRRASRLADDRFATRLIALTEGTIGEALTLLADAAVAAIDTGEERITVKLLDRVGWVLPSKRGRAAAR